MSVVEDIEERFTLVDHVSSGLTKIHEKADKLLDKFKSLAFVITGLGGIFEGHEMLTELEQTYDTVDRIHAITGLTTVHSSDLLNILKSYNIPLGKAEMLVLRMNNKFQLLDETVGQDVGTVEKLGRAHENIFKKFNINSKASSLEQFKQLADAATIGNKKGQKLGSKDLQSLGMRGDVADLLRGLQRGRGAMEEAIVSARKAGLEVSQKNVTAFIELKKAKTELKEGFLGVGLTVANHLMPAITKLIHAFTPLIEKYIPRIDSWADRFSRNLDKNLVTIKKIGKAFLEWKLFKMAAGFSKSFVPGGEGGGSGKKGASPVFPGQSAAAVFAPLRLVIELISKVGKAFGGLSAILSAGAVAVLITAITKHFDQFSPVLSKLAEAFSTIFSTVAEMLMPVLLELANVLAWVVARIADAITTARMLLPEGFGGPSQAEFDAKYKAEQDARTQERWAAVVKGFWDSQEEIHKVIGKYGDTKFTNDFRGSQFSINQNFADVDPDRIAIAFSNDLAKLGERQMSSSLSPVGAQR